MTMRKKIERVLAGPSTWDRLDPAHQDALRNKTDAILAAMEKPTEAMLRAVPFGDAEGIWRAMIGAAKENNNAT